MIRKFIDEINKLGRLRGQYTEDTELYIVDNYEVYIPSNISIADIIEILTKLNYNTTVYAPKYCVIYHGCNKPSDLEKVVYSTRAVSALIINNKNEILVEDHVKLQALTLPGGKLDATDDNKYEVLKKELFEELGIEIDDATFNYTKINYIEYPAESGVYSVHEDCNFIVYLENINGEIYNKEPEKHKSIKWMSLKELCNPNLKLSVVLQEAVNRLLRIHGFQETVN